MSDNFVFLKHPQTQVLPTTKELVYNMYSMLLRNDENMVYTSAKTEAPINCSGLNNDCNKEKSIYTCEILFDDWNYIDDICNDKDILIKFCQEVFPAGVRDRINRSELIPIKNEKDYHLPAVRLIFLTSSKTLYDNIYNTIGIEYKQRYWFMHSYKDFLDAKEYKISKASWFLRFRKHLVNKFTATQNPMLYEMISNEEWWKNQYDYYLKQAN